MKTKKSVTQPDPTAAFPDSSQPPGESDLAAALGESFAPVDEIVSQLHASHPEVTAAWQFSRQVGWYQVHLLQKRRLLYLVPKRGAFRLAMILGRKALAALLSGPHAGQVNELLRKARHYPEGTAFSFEPEALDPTLVLALLEAKISPEPCLS